MTKVVETPGGYSLRAGGDSLVGRPPFNPPLSSWSGETELHVVMKWIRSRAARPAEPAGQHCTGCRTTIPGATEDEFRAAGGVFLTSVGWFCGAKCERQYRLRFRIQPATPADGSQAASQPSRKPTPRPAPLVADPPEAPSSGRRSAADELAAALRARRRPLNNGV